MGNVVGIAGIEDAGGGAEVSCALAGSLTDVDAAVKAVACETKNCGMMPRTSVNAEVAHNVQRADSVIVTGDPSAGFWKYMAYKILK